ncbi:MAG: hypothetical protein J1F11_12910 [Oscillospiraceae bacterium]|nr:hypothetical protein [Oscillospiraceae bacterium]
MKKELPFSKEELELSEEIIRFSMRSGANEFSFLKNPIFSLKTEPTDETASVCADYKKLYYNPKWVMEQFRRNKEKTVNALIHCVLHCLLLHPSMISEEDPVFNAAADLAVLIMMHNAGAERMNVPDSFLHELTNVCGSTSTNDIFKGIRDNAPLLNKVFNVTKKHKWDDHKLWYKKDEKKKKNDPGQSGGGQDGEGQNGKGQGGEGQDGRDNGDPVIEVSVQMGTGEELWKNMFVQAKAAAQGQGYGSQHGNMFLEVKKPDRFSRFSYKEYIRRFARQEIVAEDPETIDMMLYSAGFEMYGDIALVEFNEVKENAVPSDIIIAIDISGSCSGDVAVNFLRQVYSLFEEMDIRSNVNIHAVTFDTQIIGSAVIRNRKDAEELIKNYSKYTDNGWGGTDFHCVFDYADQFSRNNSGKKLKGLFFFSDGYGAFPDAKKSYRTTFFIPVDRTHGFLDDLSFIPNWVECVRYDDDKN